MAPAAQLASRQLRRLSHRPQPGFYWLLPTVHFCYTLLQLLSICSRNSFNCRTKALLKNHTLPVALALLSGPSQGLPSAAVQIEGCLACCAGIAVACLSGPGQLPTLAVAQTHQRPLQWHHLQTEEPAFSPALTAFLELGREAYKVLQVCKSALVGGTACGQYILRSLDLLCAQLGSRAPREFIATGSLHDVRCGRRRSRKISALKRC